MSVSTLGALQREDSRARSDADLLLAANRESQMVRPAATRNPSGAPEFSFVDLGDSVRLALMLEPESRGSFLEQARELLARMRASLQLQPQPMTVTLQTVFLRDSRDQAQCEALLATHFGAEQPMTSFVLQPPCSGAALALEAWAIGGPGVRVERLGSQTLAVSYDSVRWVYCAGLRPAPEVRGAYAQTLDLLERARGQLHHAGTGFEHVVRTWFYLGNITGIDLEGTGGDAERYQELNRARSTFYQDLRFCGPLVEPGIPHGVYPASTGIGMQGSGLVASCMTLQTQRQDARLVPLENPQQTPAFAYPPRYSPRSPKFSRAMALVLGDYITTWVSGTASIVNSESCHPGDIEKQTEQTIDNIQRLIAPANFAFHGVPAAGAALQDLAKVRVYLKRPEDFSRCKAVCERRFGAVPAIYAQADICRPELLVEIEGVAFSRNRAGNRR
jgi:enamine deaminase RidA (YjgF/YER057c/UK114 family)